MACPFKHIWDKDHKKNDTPDDPLEKHSIINNNNHADPPLPPENHATSIPHQPSKECPAGFTASYATHVSSSATKCPLGFGASTGPKLSNLHCMICKSFLYDCHTTNCGHRYCNGCISRFQDCPACGADITFTSPDAATQQLVEELLAAHAGDISLWDSEDNADDDHAPITTRTTTTALPSTSKAAFLLQIALRAMHGGNIDNALHRLMQCREELLQQSNRKEGANSTPIAEKESAITSNDDGDPSRTMRGAVCGCIADCLRAQGRYDDALSFYKESLENLCMDDAVQSRGADQRDMGNTSLSHHALTTLSHHEALRSQSVTLNKIGEVHHMQGDLRKALEMYSQALDLRKQRCTSTCGGAPVHVGIGIDGGDDIGIGEMVAVIEALVDVAMSEVKVADVLKTLHEEVEEEDNEDNDDDGGGGGCEEGYEHHASEAKRSVEHAKRVINQVKKSSKSGCVEDVETKCCVLEQKLDAIVMHLNTMMMM